VSIHDLTLARKLTPIVEEACSGLETGDAPILEQVTDTTAELLRHWFQQDFKDTRHINFHPGQAQAILNTIYVHEVLQTKTLMELYSKVAPEVMLDDNKAHQSIIAPKNSYPKYCMSMATGTGKTWVLQAMIVWQLLNANRHPESDRFTKNFLVVAPGLIVYDRLLDAFMGKEIEGERNFEQADLYKYRDLFIPETYWDEVFRFAQGAACTKYDIGKKVTSGGLIAITNWHILSEEGDVFDEEEELETPGLQPSQDEVIQSIFPLTPGTTQGNDLSQLNRRYERGNILSYLKSLPDLMVFNDEAHHIHEVKKEGEITEVEWQKSLNRIAESKGDRFFQVDFSATPYNQVGSGKKTKKAYFPHIIVEFPLKTAMKQGLVKSLVLDERKEIGALNNDELSFTVDRDDDGNPSLSEGQRIMLRAGLTKLRKLERDFTQIEPDRHPKMLVICEDTSVTPLVESFLQMEGLSEDEILRVDSNRKGEIKASEWAIFREKLFDMDRHSNPRVVVSVLMLREGFDVNNICVIVPLRSSASSILLEQTIGRGLRLMWRDPEFEDSKWENRRLISEGKEPSSMIDVLSIVEHPRFKEFYEELMKEGLLGSVSEDDDSSKSSAGDLISVGLRPGYEAYDFAIPFILREHEESFEQKEIPIESLRPFAGFTLEQLKNMVGKGEKFHSVDVQSKTRFGDYRVSGGIMTATGYNDFIARLVKRISEMLNTEITDSSKVFANKSQFPYMQVHMADLAKLVDDYIKNKLFDQPFNPLEDENWRILLIDLVAGHIIREVGNKVMEAEDTSVLADDEVVHRHLSEVPKIPMRESSSIAVNKCIYERLPYPSRSGGLEQAFIETADRDASVIAFCKVHEQKHSFLRLRYIKEDGVPAFYSPDFLVLTDTAVYLVETKSDDATNNLNVRRKQKAAQAWCDRINQLKPSDRMDVEWHYALLSESFFYDWRDKGASMETMLEYAKIRPVDQGQLGLNLAR
jgi:type III restriction enzyme